MPKVPCDKVLLHIHIYLLAFKLRLFHSFPIDFIKYLLSFVCVFYFCQFEFLDNTNQLRLNFFLIIIKAQIWWKNSRVLNTILLGKLIQNFPSITISVNFSLWAFIQKHLANKPGAILVKIFNSNASQESWIFHFWWESFPIEFVTNIWPVHIWLSCYVIQPHLLFVVSLKLK